MFSSRDGTGRDDGDHSSGDCIVWSREASPGQGIAARGVCEVVEGESFVGESERARSATSTMGPMSVVNRVCWQKISLLGWKARAQSAL